MRDGDTTAPPSRWPTRTRASCRRLRCVAAPMAHACPVMRSRARFHADHTRRKLDDQCAKLVARYTRLDQHRFAGLIHAVDGKHVRGKIDSDGDNWHGLPLLLVLMKFRHSIMALRCRLAASAAASGRGSPFHSDRSRYQVVSRPIYVWPVDSVTTVDHISRPRP